MSERQGLQGTRGRGPCIASLPTDRAAPAELSCDGSCSRQFDNTRDDSAMDEIDGKSTRIRLFDFSTPQMRAFHMSWIAFFLCFFAWFGIAPLMAVVRAEFQLTKDQVGWCVIGSV